MRALGWLLLWAGCSLFLVTVDRSMWVLLAIGVVIVGAALVVEGYVDVETVTLAEAADRIDAELRRIPVDGGVITTREPMTAAQADALRRAWAGYRNTR